MTDIVSKDRIERDAREAFVKGLSLADACPYPWGTPAADHFKAAYYAAPIIAAWEERGGVVAERELLEVGHG